MKDKIVAIGFRTKQVRFSSMKKKYTGDERTLLGLAVEINERILKSVAKNHYRLSPNSLTRRLFHKTSELCKFHKIIYIIDHLMCGATTCTIMSGTQDRGQTGNDVI